MSPVALIIAILGFCTSATLAGIKVWEAFIAKSRFQATFHWYDDEQSDTELTVVFTIANTGYRADSIREFLFEAEDGELSLPPSNRALPLLLQPGELSQRFEERIVVNSDWDPHSSLWAGTASLIVVNSVGKRQAFPVPNAYDAGILGPADPPSAVKEST